MNSLSTLAAPGISGGQIVGAITLSGLSLAAAILLLSGLRGSRRVKIDTQEKAAWWGIITGTLWKAAGNSWADIADGIGSLPKSLLGGDSGFGNPGIGGIAVALTALAFVWDWKARRVIPAFLGIAAGVVYGEAGGIWGILVNIIRMAAAKITGGA